MALVLDTGPLLAYLDGHDRDHERCAPLFARRGDFVLPTLVLGELDHHLHRMGRPEAMAIVAEDVRRGAYGLASLTQADFLRAAALERQYADLGLGLVDASVIALCERLGETKVATLDHPHFSVVRPLHCERLELLPE